MTASLGTISRLACIVLLVAPPLHSQTPRFEASLGAALGAPAVYSNGFATLGLEMRLGTLQSVAVSVEAGAMLLLDRAECHVRTSL